MSSTDTLPPHPTLTEYFPDELERRRFVARIFDESAADYDWIIQAMSLGSGQHYRRQALARAGLEAGMHVLDVACGTGAVSRAAQRIAGVGQVVAADPSEGMLRSFSRSSGLSIVRAAAEDLPFADAHFDFLSMGYALRHVRDLRETFTEYRRVLKPGGRLLLLEMTRPPSKFGMWMAKAYLHRFVPALAALRGGRSARTLMRYFWDTIEHCVAPATIVDALREAGLESVDHRLCFGLFSEYQAREPGPSTPRKTPPGQKIPPGPMRLD